MRKAFPKCFCAGKRITEAKKTIWITISGSGVASKYVLRLMNDTGLAPAVREDLLAYLRAHTKGGASEETWEVVLEEHGDEREYYRFLLDHDCINDENFSAVLEDMGERHTEMKAFLMNARGARPEMEEAFAALSFDL